MILFNSIRKGLLLSRKNVLTPIRASSLTTYEFLNRTIDSLNKGNDKVFITDRYRSYTYGEIVKLSERLSRSLNSAGNGLKSQRVGIYCSNTHSYLISVLAVWMANGVPFCLNKRYPARFIEYFLDDAECRLVVNSVKEPNPASEDTEFDRMLRRKKIVNFKLAETVPVSGGDDDASPRTMNYEKLMHQLCEDEKKREALLLYTSGTSGPSKGVVITFENLLSSIENIITAYEWTPADTLLNPLPLNHYSGLVYGSLTPFMAGCSMILMEKFNANTVWRHMLEPSSNVNMLIGVPTIYAQLLEEYAKNAQLNSRYTPRDVSDILGKKMRLIASGSAPLNVKLFDDWYNLTNYRILERYGMTEIGMALTNPYRQSADVKRIGGTVGRPCGNIKARIYDHVNSEVLVISDADDDCLLRQRDEIFGELQIKGPVVFKEYLKKPEQTKESFTTDGWFKTGTYLHISFNFKFYL